MSYRCIFERATADYDIGREDEPLRLFEEGGEKQVIECEGVDGYVGEMEHLVECVRLGQVPSVSAADGLRQWKSAPPRKNRPKPAKSSRSADSMAKRWFLLIFAKNALVAHGRLV